MEVNKRKDNLVKLLLNKDFDIKDEDELVEMLLDSPIAIDSDKEEDAKRSLGDKLADKVTAVAGSWGFIIVFSCIAALQAPIIMMSQNRAAKKDSLRSLNDYKTDLKSELILEVLHEQIKELQSNQKKIIKLLEENNK